jgi:hypothetical protein
MAASEVRLATDAAPAAATPPANPRSNPRRDIVRRALAIDSLVLKLRMMVSLEESAVGPFSDPPVREAGSSNPARPIETAARA